MSMIYDTSQMGHSWKKLLSEEYGKTYFIKLSDFIKNEYKNKSIYPIQPDIFRAFGLCHYEDVKVVILGQDPYHGLGQANGLSFAVQKDARLPPSLKNIFKEIESDLKIKVEKNGDLTRWAKQGVLLLNATLTVELQSPGSHQNKGWEEFTNAVIEKISDGRENIVFILWGNYAKKKGDLIDRAKHLVVESTHPSPFSAYNGFFGSRPFSKTNKYLKKNNKKVVDWR